MSELPGGIADIEITGRAGTGGMSEVYRARRVSDGAPVAVKVLHDMWRQELELVARFHNEARLLSELRHRHIVAALAHGTLDDGRPYLVLEWMPSDLARALTDRAPVPLGHARRVGAALASALAELHARGIVHRDLKPANVLLSGDELAAAELKLGDLGLAKIPAAAVASASPATGHAVSTGARSSLGTGDYMAPEQWFGAKTVDAAADVYALGVLLFRMLSGRLPFAAEHERELMVLHLFESPPWELLEHLAHDTEGARALYACLRVMLDKSAAQRPSAAAIADALAS